MEQIPLIINPMARSAKHSRINKWLEKHQNCFRVIESESPQHMYQYVRDYAGQGEKMVAVAGGDGTLRMAVKALLGTETALAVVPSGTANVFARELGIFNASFSKAWDAIEGGCVKDVDVFLVNDTPFIQMAGIGLDARAIELTTTELKKKIGGLAYVVAGVKAAFEHQPQLTITTAEGEIYHGMAAIFGNGSKYGGPMKIFGKADQGDGFLDMIVFKKTPLHIIKDCLLAGLRGGFDDEMQGDFDYVQTKGCTVESDVPPPYELDGDLGGHGAFTVAKYSCPLKVVTLPH